MVSISQLFRQHFPGIFPGSSSNPVNVSLLGGGFTLATTRWAVWSAGILAGLETPRAALRAREPPEGYTPRRAETADIPWKNMVIWAVRNGDESCWNMGIYRWFGVS